MATSNFQSANSQLGNQNSNPTPPNPPPGPTPTPGPNASPTPVPVAGPISSPFQGDAPTDPTAVPGVFVSFDWNCSNGIHMPYRLMFPSNYNSSYKYPLTVNLSDHDQDMMSDSPEFIDEVGSVYNLTSTRQNYPSFILVPQNIPGAGWGDSTDYTIPSGDCARELIHQIVSLSGPQTYSIDTHRIYMVGPWQGAEGVYDLLSREPNFFAAGLPQGGSVASSMFAPQLVNKPIYAFYGTFGQGQGHLPAIQALQSAVQALGGTQFTLVVTPLGDPAGMYGPWNINPLRPGVLDWLYSKRLP